MYAVVLREHSLPLLNRRLTVPCRAKLSATHQHCSAEPATPAVGVWRMDHFRKTRRTGPLGEKLLPSLALKKELIFEEIDGC